MEIYAFMVYLVARRKGHSMQVTGDIWKDGKFWVVDCQTLNASTQGRTQKEALAMMVDWVKTMVDDSSYDIDIEMVEKRQFVMRVKNALPLVALIISRSRGASKKTLLQLAEDIGLKSPNSIHQYEAGKHDTGIARLNELLDAMGFDLNISVTRRGHSDVA